MSSINEIVSKLIKKRLLEAKMNYSEMDHDELIKLAQQKDQRAFEELLTQYDNLISKQARRVFLNSGSGDYEDMKQTASLAFWEAVKSYNPDIHKGGFGAYANMIISRKLADELRKDSADKRQINNMTLSTDDVLSDDGEGGEFTLGDTLASDDLSPEEQYLGKDGANKILRFMRDEFSEREREVVKRHLRGAKISEIAEEMELSYKAVENTLMRIKNKLADYMRKSYKESKKLEESGSIEFSDEEKQILESVMTKIDESDSDYDMFSKLYKNKAEFKDKYKESGNMRDLLDDLQNKGIEYEIYYSTRDNGCTIFYDDEE